MLGELQHGWARTATYEAVIKVATQYYGAWGQAALYYKGLASKQHDATTSEDGKLSAEHEATAA